MSATNHTPNLQLPQFLPTDKPSWLGDINGAMLAIDTGYGKQSDDISAASTKAGAASAQSNANQIAIQQVNNEINSIDQRVQALEAGSITEELNTKVANLETETTTIKGQVDSLEADVSTAQGDIATANTNISTLSGQVATNSSQINSLGQTVQEVSEVANNANDIANKSITFQPYGFTTEGITLYNNGLKGYKYGQSLSGFMGLNLILENNWSYPDNNFTIGDTNIPIGSEFKGQVAAPCIKYRNDQFTVDYITIVNHNGYYAFNASSKPQVLDRYYIPSFSI